MLPLIFENQLQMKDPQRSDGYDDHVLKVIFIEMLP